MVDLVALSFLPVSRWRLVAERLRDGTAPQAILQSECARTPRGGRRRTPSELLTRAQFALERADRFGLVGLAWDDPVVPEPLRHLVDPPPVVWVRGRLACLDRPAVAVVGSRAGSPYALAVAERLAGDLAAKGVVVVSGLARGVDAAAHRGTLEAGGVTVGVLGCGADRVYPAEHAPLATAIVERGALISELAPGTPPQPIFFPRRNRIISALARAVVVVEAGERSGSLITARCALEQGRDVLAVPGNVLSGRNRGGHALLRDGARLVESADDVLEEIGLAARPAGTADSPNRSDDPVLACLWEGEAADLDEISAQSGLAIESLLSRLLDLELRGVVRRAGGGRFVRV